MSLTLSDPPEVTTAAPVNAAPVSVGPTSIAPASTAPASRRTPHRDRAIDLIRFGCLIVVVILHSLMSAAVLGADGQVVPTVALSGTIGFTVASWFYQIMPLFFFIGGYAAISGWRRTQATGGTWADYLRARLRRLVVPVAVLIGIAGLGLSIASELEVPTSLLAEASTRIGQPLWFLAVYVGLTSLVPLAVHFHERAPRRTIVALVGAVVGVDGVVALTGVTGFEYLNFLFVWPLIQQCGFFYADALHRRVRRWSAWTVMVSALVVLGGFVGLGVYSPNMLVNLNPPTGALVLLGVAQMCVLRLSHARLHKIVSGSTWERILTWGNTYGIQVYLWHMPIVITLIGFLGFGAALLAGAPVGDGTFLAGILLPEIESSWWWLTRLPWLVTVMGLAGLLATGMSKVPFPGEERLARVGQLVARVANEIPMRRNVRPAGESRVRPKTHRLRQRLSSSASRAIIAVASAMSGIAIALLVGVAPLIWTLVSVAALVTSLVLAAGLKTQAPETAAVSLKRSGPIEVS
ncbi:MAG: acyltransferase [Brevibacterium sp.]|nr:acyltransferase [Brevibacterium sp.]